jgi:hypothetical protein
LFSVSSTQTQNVFLQVKQITPPTTFEKS